MKKYLSILTTLALSTSAILSSSSLLNSYVKKSNLIEIYNLNNVVQSINIIEVPIFANKGKTITKTFEKNVIIAFSDPLKLKYIELTDIKSHVDFHINGKDYYHSDQNPNAVVVDNNTKFVLNYIENEGNMNEIQQTISYDYF